MIENLFRPTHLLLVLAIAALLFPKNLPQIGRGLGEAIRGFKTAVKDAESDPSEPICGPDPPEQPVRQD